MTTAKNLLVKNRQWTNLLLKNHLMFQNQQWTNRLKTHSKFLKLPKLLKQTLLILIWTISQSLMKTKIPMKFLKKALKLLTLTLMTSQSLTILIRTTPSQLKNHFQQTMRLRKKLLKRLSIFRKLKKLLTVKFLTTCSMTLTKQIRWLQLQHRLVLIFLTFLTKKQKKVMQAKTLIQKQSAKRQRLRLSSV